MEPSMSSALLEALAAMRAAGHAPASCLVVRFADGRLRLYPADAESWLATLRNEHGPCEAYLVTGEGVRACAPEPRAASLSRNAAIFLASLGMTTGALPNVEDSLSPAGVSSWPVR
jgi:hypothetical protein